MSEAKAPARVRPRDFLVALCGTLGTATYAFTWNSVGVALPHMQGTFSATTDQITWVMIAFIIGSAMTTSSISWFSGRFGRRQVFLWATAGYTVTLLGCGMATTLEQEVAWRFLQGIFGAALIPLGQIIAVNAFPPDRHGQATSLWALGFVSANVISPTIGGALIEHHGWSWMFFYSIPISLAVLALSWIMVPEAPKQKKDLDWFGFLTLILGVGVLQLMLARGERLDWFDSTEILVEAVIAAVLIYLFLVHTFTSKHSFIDISIFRDRNFALGQGFIFMIGAVLYLPLLLLPLLLQNIGGYPAIETGNLLMSRGVGSMLGLLLLMRLRDRVDPRPIFVLGLLGTVYPAWEMAHWTAEVRAIDVIVTNFIQGLATGAVWAPLNTLTLRNLKKHQQDQGFALFYLNFDLGNAFGTAAIIGLHTRYSQINQAVLNEHITPFNELLRYPALSGAWPLDEAGGLASIQAELVRQATMIAYNNSFLVISIMIAAMLPFIIFFRKPRLGASA